MSSHSPQRSRKPQAHQSQGSVHNAAVPPREMSPSPTTQRPRNTKTNSMPSVMQLFNVNQQASPQQSSPTASSRRSPPLAVGQVHRVLPTPPHPPVPITEQERRINSPSPQTVNTHYPRPVRQLSSQFLASFQGLDDNLHMTDELLADIERADQQRNQTFAYPASTYPTMGYTSPNKDDTSSPKDPNVERVRNTGKSSPKDVDGRRQQQHRPLSRDKQASSPMTQSQALSQTPERRNSPTSYHTPLGSPGESSNSYIAINQKSPHSLPPRTPPALVAVRTPDKSLPVQEEPEDDHLQMRGRKGSHDWLDNDGAHHGASPAPSSDLHPEGNNQRSHRVSSGRNSRAGHRDQEEEDDDTLVGQSSVSREDEEGHTPRSPTSALPEVAPDKYQQYRGNVPALSAPRPRGRTAAADQLDMRSLHPDILEQQPTAPDRRDEPPQYAESRNRPVPQQQQQQQRQPHSQQDHYNASRYYSPQMFTDDFLRDPTSAYLQALMGPSPRPDAPIPPTPHSQTSPPSPSQHYDPRHELPPFSPVAPAGSPYPYPFSHVRRNYPSVPPPAPESYENVDLNHPSVISEQMKRQYQIYAQNNLGSHISDSTFSPRSTPFPPHANYFNQWASWHTHRLLGNPLGNVVRDPMSIRSSPSHEPISLPAPPTVGIRKNGGIRERTGPPPKPNPLKRSQSMVTRKPPPRVDSTQPRETSPEPSSSGESTAGGDDTNQHFALHEEGNWVNGNLPVRVVRDDDDLCDWIDEDEYEDEEDYLELEYHPSYVNNVEKRRRRWETKWEALLQAFQTLDRQTDATLLLLASPTHSSKLHLVSSRSIRRTPGLARSPALSSIRSGFRAVATQRRSIRSLRSSLADRLLTSSSQSNSPSSPGGTTEEDLKRALSAALGSLSALGQIYDEREARWKDEMLRVQEDRERIEMLLRQALGKNGSSPNEVNSTAATTP